MNRTVTPGRAFLDRMKQLSPHCRQAIRLQVKAMDHKLTPLERLGLRIHLVWCRRCRRDGAQFRRLRQASQQLPHASVNLPNKSLSPQARERLRKILEEAQK